MLVAFHDAALDRVTDAAGAIGSATAARLRQVRIAGTEPVPTLVELLEALPDARLNLDLKDTAAVAPLAALLADRGEEHRVVVGSFSAARLRAFRRLSHGRVATSAHVAEVVAYRLLPSARLAGAVVRAMAGAGAPGGMPRGPVALQVPDRVGPLRVVTAGLVRRAHAAGVEVHVWVVDDADRMRALVALGVDGIMTDRTDILAGVMSELGLWPPR